MSRPSQSPRHRSVNDVVRQRINHGGERLWRLEDFRDLPFGSVAQSLSRLAKAGAIDRLSKGLYFRHRQTAFGKSRPNPATIRNLAKGRKTIFPSGIAAANRLGFSTQTARQSEVATTALSLPRKLLAPGTIVHTRRPAAWNNLSEQDAALLDFLRQGGNTSELSPEQTVRRVLDLFSQPGQWERLLRVAATEPPRIRAMLGAIGTHRGCDAPALNRLRATLNPFSKFDFGRLSGLPHAREWQARATPKKSMASTKTSPK